MTVISAQFRTVAGTAASLGTTGGTSVVVDRPDGRAGGLGLGLNGGQLLALAVGGCLCNDLRHTADATGTDLPDFTAAVDVTVGDTGLVTAVAVRVRPLDGDPAAFADLLARAAAGSTVVRSLVAGVPVDVTTG
ncbi:OsmC family protein [Kineococcus glutinatus]|uniref:OsmC family protein n=1 Tax=Kineococcus glutinatus TaxID=1070872 RepID=A0ABP9HFJ8_9ACTN